MPVTSRLVYRRSPTAPSLQLARHLTYTTPRRQERFHRSDFHAGSWTGYYEPERPVEGPLSQASLSGASSSRLTPSRLKEYLDKYVVGQDKAKKVTSVAIYNHYQRIREIRRQEEELEEKEKQRERWESAERERTAHPVENEYPGHIESVDLNVTRRVLSSPPPQELGSKTLEENSLTVIEKSNLLLLGPSGVGKTYILQTLARTLEVPFATVDCSALTQAGYIGTDIESAIERLLLASSHSISKCETGIIFFDEVDKLAKPAIMTHGRDVSGEGVQQGLLKMIEGTTVTINAKPDRSSKSEHSKEKASKDTQQYTIDTTNILFVFAGAFIGLDKIISKRLATNTSTLGFGSALPPKTKSAQAATTHNLHHVTPSDLQSYGLIPELLGRIPITVALTPLTQHQLVSILTEPKNSLVRQYTALFASSGIALRFTTAALHAVAGRALDISQTKSEKEGRATGGGGGGGIGARGLRSILESILQDLMFWGPGSSIRFSLIDEAFVLSQSPESSESESESNSGSHSGSEGGGSERSAGEEKGNKNMPRCWSRGQSRLFEEAYEREEVEWERRHSSSATKEPGAASFERLRRVGSSGM